MIYEEICHSFSEAPQKGVPQMDASSVSHEPIRQATNEDKKEIVLEYRYQKIIYEVHSHFPEYGRKAGEMLFKIGS
jgi:hypothetical protein